MFAEGDGPQGAGPCWDGAVQHVSWAALAGDGARPVAGDGARAVAGDGARAVAGDGAGVVAVVARPVGEVLVAGVVDASRVLARTAVTVLSAPRCAEGELVAGLDALDTLAARVQRVMVAVLVEAHRRGLHLDTGLSVHDWVTQRCPGLSNPQVGDLSTVVKSWDAPGHHGLREAVTAGDVSVARAARLVRALTRVSPVTDTATYQQVVDLLVPVAAQELVKSSV